MDAEWAKSTLVRHVEKYALSAFLTAVLIWVLLMVVSHARFFPEKEEKRPHSPKIRRSERLRRKLERENSD